MALAYSIEEAMKLTGLGKTGLYQEMRAGRLDAKKAGRRTIIPHESLQAWLQALPPFNPPLPPSATPKANGEDTAA